MLDSIPLPAAADAAPDWAVATGNVVCPLCDYNLRGLTEPQHAFWTIIASQVILFLAVTAVIANISYYGFR